MTQTELVSGIEAQIRHHLTQLRKECEGVMNPSDYVQAARRHTKQGEILAYDNILRYIIINKGRM